MRLDSNVFVHVRFLAIKNPFFFLFFSFPFLLPGLSALPDYPSCFCKLGKKIAKLLITFGIFSHLYTCICGGLCTASSGGFDQDIYGTSKPEVNEIRAVEDEAETSSRDFTMVC